MPIHDWTRVRAGMYHFFDEHTAEIEAALTEENQTVMVVPTELVPEILELINNKRPA